FGGIAGKSGIGVPVDGAILLHLEGGITVLVGPFAVVVFHRRRISRPIGQRMDGCRGQNEADGKRRGKARGTFHTGFPDKVGRRPMERSSAAGSRSVAKWRSAV